MILQPGDIAIDYSFARPNPAAIAAAGVRMVCRYISPIRGNKKNLTVIERDALHAAGPSITLVWEAGPTEPLLGAPKGTIHGAQAGDFAQALGYPADIEIIVAVDFDVQPAQLPAVLAYLAAFKAASRWRQGAYGKDTLITAAHDAGVSTLGWQTVAWSHKRISPHAHVLQHATPVHPQVPPLGAVDDNTVLRSFKAWSLAPDPPPSPQPSTEDSDMDVVTNAEDFDAANPAGTVKFAVAYRGQSLYHLSGPEWVAGGSKPGVPMSNVDLDGLAAIPMPTPALPVIDYDMLAAKVAARIPPVVIPPITVPPLTGHIVADLGDKGHITGSVG